MHRRSVHGRGAKHNCNWKPAGREKDYTRVYVEAVLAKDKIRVSMCLTKDRYSSQESAQLTIQRRETKSGKLLRVYQCPFCGGYHLTSKPEADMPMAA